MNNKKNKEELQSRRQFFKKAAKATLPIIGAVVLASAPAIAKAAEIPSSTCNGNCYGRCMNNCTGTCRGTCRTTCQDSCKGNCKYSCRITCTGGCAHSNY